MRAHRNVLARRSGPDTLFLPKFRTVWCVCVCVVCGLVIIMALCGFCAKRKSWCWNSARFLRNHAGLTLPIYFALTQIYSWSPAVRHGSVVGSVFETTTHYFNCFFVAYIGEVHQNGHCKRIEDVAFVINTYIMFTLKLHMVIVDSANSIICRWVTCKNLKLMVYVEKNYKYLYLNTFCCSYAYKSN